MECHESQVVFCVDPRNATDQVTTFVKHSTDQISGKRTQLQTPEGPCVHQIFELWAERRPQRIALVDGDTTVTYSELNHRANHVAHHLLSLGLEKESLVGIVMERSADLIVSILGVLKAGCAYVPFDPNSPKARLAIMLEDAAPSVILSQSSSGTAPVNRDQRWLFLDQLDPACFGGNNPDLDCEDSDLAYVMFTSGSTGRPKGVMVEHRSVVRLVTNTDYADFNEENVFLLLAPVTFDASTLEAWGALLNGARLVIMPAGSQSLPDLGAEIKKHGVTTLWLTAGLFHLMVDERLDDLRPLRQLLAGGDVLSVPHVQRALAALPCDLINGYGPTENTTFTCCYKIPRGTDLGKSIPIGTPIANTQVHILDEHLLPVPDGEVGEIFAAGAGVARGYLNRDELTAQKFVYSPHPDLSSTRLYRTGDLGRVLPDGNIEFFGRVDNQVKIRGYRVELEEIEAALTAQPGIRQAVVVAREVSAGNKQLIAFVVPKVDERSQSCMAKTRIEEVLPEYMVPTFMFEVDELPLTHNGKVDRSALLNDIARASNRNRVFSAPESAIERIIADELEAILKAGPIGSDDNFFDLGANSLQLASLHNRLQSTVDPSVKITSLFQNPTARTLAQFLTTRGVDTPQSSPVQERAARQRAALERRKRAQVGGAAS